MLGPYYDTGPVRAPSSSSRSASSRSTTTAPAYIVNEQALVQHQGAHHYSQEAETPLPLQTLDDVRSQVAQEMAIRAVNKAQVVDGVKVGVIFSIGKEEADFLRRIADHVFERLRLSSSFLFILADTTPHINPAPPLPSASTPWQQPREEEPGNALFILGSSSMLVQRAALLTSSKFIGRVLSSSSPPSGSLYTFIIRALGSSTYDDTALTDILHKAARQPIDPLLPPPHSTSIAQMLSTCRAKLQRVTPRQAYQELFLESQVPEAPTLLVDIRPTEQRARTGGIPGCLVIERNVLEWRLDPRSDARLAIADRYDLRVILFCQEGYASSLAAYSLQQLGLLNATDIIGGYEAWRLAGLPIDTESEGRTVGEERSLASRAGSVV